jgi:hypothetical protein
MDNEEHHPHLVNVSWSNYSNDNYKSNNEYTDKEFCVGCGCTVILTIILFSVLFFAFDKAEFEGDRKAGNFCACAACNNRCNDAKVKERLEAEAKKAEARRKFVDDSIARYQVLHDSILETIRVKDSIDAALVNQKKIKVDFIAFIDDGVTSREVTVNSLNDSLSPNDVTLLGEAFGEMAYTSAKDRQFEIDNNKEYYTKRIKNKDQ